MYTMHLARSDVPDDLTNYQLILLFYIFFNFYLDIFHKYLDINHFFSLLYCKIDVTI